MNIEEQIIETLLNGGKLFHSLPLGKVYLSKTAELSIPFTHVTLATLKRLCDRKIITKTIDNKTPYKTKQIIFHGGVDEYELTKG